MVVMWLKMVRETQSEQIHYNLAPIAGIALNTSYSGTAAPAENDRVNRAF